MKKNIIKFTFIIILLSLVITPSLALAQNTNTSVPLLDKLENVGTQDGGYNAGISPPQIIGFIIGAFINFLGLAFIVLVIVAGYGWMTAGGNEEKVKKAATTLKEATIGLVLSISAWALWNFVFESLVLKGSPT